MPYDLRSYMGGRYLQVNQAARITPNVNTLPADMQTSLATIDKELDDIGRPVPQGTRTYRHAGLTAHHGNPAQGTIITDRAYVSSSLNEGNYSWANKPQHSENLLYMTIICRAFGLGRNVTHVRGNGQEQEVLFHRNVRFLLRTIETDTRGNRHWILEEQNSPNAGYTWGAHTL